jgi:diguanylate cyclase (GGDEF)-like protein/putative nucleotidyltransferase with HDIG domain
MGLMTWHPGENADTYGVGQPAVPRRKRPVLHPADTATIARAFGVLGIGAALVGFLGVVLPHPADFDEPVIHATQASALIVSIILLVYADRLPLWAVSVTPAIGVVNTSVAILATHDPTSGYAFFYIWIAIVCFYFLSRRETIVHLAWAIANYAAVILILGPTAGPAHQDAYFFVLVAGTLIASAGPMLYLRGRFNDLVERLSDASRIDAVTGLPNERVLGEALKREIARAHGSGTQLAVLVVELDRFQEVTEELGHTTAGELQRSIGEMFSEAIRPIDTIARTAGTYTIIAPEAPEESAYLLAEQLLARVRRSFRGETIPLTASIGIGLYPRDAAGEGELLRIADRALTAAKLLGHDRAVIYGGGVEEVLGGGRAGERLRNPQTHLATLLSLAEAVDLRDSGTAQHSHRVGEYCERLARHLGLSQSRVARVRIAGILHDIGKVGIPDSILAKEGPLDEGEWTEMRKHPEIGARILGTRELVDVRDWVLCSHERPDGKGYPRGLVDHQIPLEAKIISVADAYEAMTVDRSYRMALSHAAARERLIANAGTQFDPEVVTAFLASLDEAPGVSEAPETAEANGEPLAPS